MRSSATRDLAVLSLVSVIATSGLTAQAGAEAAPAPQGLPAVDETADACFGAAERAQPLLRQKRFREARALLDVCARDACPHSVRSDCREWLAEATDAQSSIVIAAHEVRGEGETRTVSDVHGVHAVIDEVLVIDDADQTPIAIDPGRHRLRLERTGASAMAQYIDVREGEKSRVIDVYWEIPVVVGARPVPPSAYVTGAIGVVAMGIGTYFEIAGLSQRNQLDTTCKPTQTCSPTLVGSARTQIAVGDATLGGGLLLLAGAALLYFTRPTVDAPTTRGKATWTLEVSPLAAGMGRRGGGEAARQERSPGAASRGGSEGWIPRDGAPPEEVAPRGTPLGGATAAGLFVVLGAHW